MLYWFRYKSLFKYRNCVDSYLVFTLTVDEGFSILILLLCWILFLVVFLVISIFGLNDTIFFSLFYLFHTELFVVFMS